MGATRRRPGDDDDFRDWRSDLARRRADGDKGARTAESQHQVRCEERERLARKTAVDAWEGALERIVGPDDDDGR